MFYKFFLHINKYKNILSYFVKHNTKNVLSTSNNTPNKNFVAVYNNQTLSNTIS